MVLAAAENKTKRQGNNNFLGLCYPTQRKIIYNRIDKIIMVKKRKVYFRLDISILTNNKIYCKCMIK